SLGFGIALHQTVRPSCLILALNLFLNLPRAARLARAITRPSSRFSRHPGPHHQSGVGTMCDDNILQEMSEHLSRRKFGALGMGAAFAAAIPRAANAMDVIESMVEITTPDGVCEAHFVHPSSGKAPGVLVWPDAFGLRDAFKQMGRRLAESGYA